MSLKAEAPFLDPVLGQNMELGLCGERMEVKEMLLLGSFTFFAHSSLLSLHIARGLSIVTENRVKEWSFEVHLNLVQHPNIYKLRQFFSQILQTGFSNTSGAMSFR
jgi:hypothetical protein